MIKIAVVGGRNFSDVNLANRILTYAKEHYENIMVISGGAKGADQTKWFESWLGPFNEFVDCALQAHNIARKENTNGDIKDIAKRVGSDYTLTNKKLKVEYKLPFTSLRAAGLARATVPDREQNSISVDSLRKNTD